MPNWKNFIPFARNTPAPKPSQSVDSKQNIVVGLETARISAQGMWRSITGNAELWNPDRVISRKGYAYLRSMVHEGAYLHGLVRQRIKGATSIPWEVQPASEDGADIAIAEFVREALKRIKTAHTNEGFTDALQHALSSVPFGWSIQEKVWADAEWAPGYKTIGACKQKQLDDIFFSVDDFGNIIGLTQRISGQSTPLDPANFWIMVFEGEPGNPYGVGLLSRAYWPDWYLRECEKFEAISIERFAMPKPTIKLGPRATTATRDEAGKILNSIQAGTGFVIPDGLEIEFTEAKNSGGAEMERFRNALQRNLQILILGQSLTSGGDSGGSYALGKVHEGVLQNIINDDLSMLCNSVQSALVKPLVDINFGVGNDYPTFRMHAEEQESLTEMAAMLETLGRTGMAIPRAWAYEKFGIPEPAEGDDVLVASTPQEEPPPETNAEKSYSCTAPTVHFAGERPRESVPFSRELTKFEEAAGTDFVGISETSQALADSGVRVAREVWIGIRDDLVKRVINAGVIEKGKTFVALDPPITKFANALQDVHVAAVVNGYLSGSDELERLRKFAEVEGSGLIDEPIPSAEALKLLTDKNTVTATEAKRISSFSHDRSLTIASVESEEALKVVRNALIETLDTGVGADGFRNIVNKQFEQWTGGIAGKGLDVLTETRLNLVYRNHIMGALNHGRREIFKLAEDERTPDPVLAYQYTAILDDSTTEFCAQMDGTVWAANAPELKTIYPPNHHNCRSMIVPVLTTQLNEMPASAITTQLPVINGSVLQPATGWGG